MALRAMRDSAPFVAVPPRSVAVFPLAAIVAACCIVRALYYSARGAIFWRGREIKVR